MHGVAQEEQPEVRRASIAPLVLPHCILSPMGAPLPLTLWLLSHKSLTNSRLWKAACLKYNEAAVLSSNWEQLTTVIVAGLCNPTDSPKTCLGRKSQPSAARYFTERFSVFNSVIHQMRRLL